MTVYPFTTGGKKTCFTDFIFTYFFNYYYYSFSVIEFELHGNNKCTRTVKRFTLLNTHHLESNNAEESFINNYEKVQHRQQHRKQKPISFQSYHTSRSSSLSSSCIRLTNVNVKDSMCLVAALEIL